MNSLERIGKWLAVPGSTAVIDGFFSSIEYAIQNNVASFMKSRNKESRIQPRTMRQRGLDELFLSTRYTQQSLWFPFQKLVKSKLIPLVI
jgi:hypothetical protein